MRTTCRTTKLTLSIMIVSMIGWTTIAAAQSSDEIMVTATRVEKNIQDVPYTVNVISAEEIRASGATSLAGLLRDLPAAQITSTGAAGVTRISLRGESSSRTLILVDGMKITEQKSMDGTPLLIDINNIERIEIIKGPGSVLYGSEAIGGAINVITKKGGNRPVEGSLSATYDTSSAGNLFSAAIHGSLREFYYRVDGSQTDYDKRKDADGDKLDGTEYERQSYSLLAGYRNDRFDGGIKYEKFESESMVYTMPYPGMFMELPEWDREKLSGWFEYRNPGALLSKARLSLFRQETFKEFINNMDIPINPFMTMQRRGRTENTLDTTGVLGQADLQLNTSNLLITGFEFNIDDLNAVDDIRTNMGADTYTRSDAKQTTYSLFVHDEQMIGENLILGGGLRYSRIQNEITSTNNSLIPDKDTNFDSTVGSLSLVYRGINNTTLRVLYSSGYRAPNLQQLYMGTSHGSATPTLSNPDLDPEKSSNYEVGAHYANQLVDVDLALFHTRSKDYIATVTIPYGTGTARQFTNVDKSITSGVELIAKLLVGDFTPYVSGSYMRRKFEQQGFSTYKTGQPELSGRLGLRYAAQFGRSVTINSDLYARYAAKAEEEAADGSIDKTAAYTTLNLSISGSYPLLDDRTLMLTLEALNLTDKDYELAMSPIPEPGRHFLLKASINF